MPLPYFLFWREVYIKNMSIVFSDDKQYIINNTTGQQLIYVHKHVENFDSAAATGYFQQKQLYGEKMLERYRENFVSHLSLPDNIKQLLNFSTVQGQEQLITAIDEGIIEGLQTSIMNASTDLQALSSQARQAYNSEGFKNIGVIIEKIDEAAKIVLGNSNALSILLNDYRQNNLSLSGLSAEIANKLSLQNKEGQVIGFNSVTLNKAASSLMKLINAGIEETLTRESVKGYFNNIFSTAFGEGLVAIGVAKNIVHGADDIVDQLLVGGKIPIKRSTTFAQDYSSLINSTYKADISTGTDNLQITINETGSSIGIQLGLSVKQYSSNNDSVAIVSGKSFAQILGALFSDGKYYAYNTLGLLGDTQSQYREMKKAIILSYADNFLSGTGSGTDFAQYIIINGRAYPIYTILKSVVKNTTGALSGEQDTSDPIVISIAGASALQKMRNKYPGRNTVGKAWQRVKEINNKILHNLKVEGHFIPSNLVKI